MAASKFLRGVGYLAGGTALAQGLTFLVTPFLSRLYLPEEFGVFAVFTSLLSIFVVLASLRYEWAIPLPKEEESAANLLALSLLITGTIALLIGLSVWLWGSEMSSMLNTPGLSSVLWLLPFSFLGAGVYQSLHYWALRKQAYPRIMSTKWKQSIGMSVVQLGSGLIHAGPLGLALGDMVGRVSGTGSLLLTSWKQDRVSLQGISWGNIRKAARRYMKFPLFSSWSALLNTISMQIPILFLGYAYHAEIVGHFSFSLNLVSAPLTLVSNAVSNVYMAEMSKLMLEMPEQAEIFFWKTLRNLVFVIPLVALLALFAPWLFAVVFGEEWRDAGLYLQISSPMLALSFLANSIGFTIIVLERQDLHAIRELIRLPLMLLAVVLSVTLSFSSTLTIAALCTAGAVGYLIHGYLSWYAIRRAPHLSQKNEREEEPAKHACQ
ncbi:oligosaccharide flippase family protein [Brevibacillus ruminantium]|uniref:Oligosaccharide flippase family protein n=1 Tax=Brevibacillus ruminantium TaxID=2950604 RepID=A0ABY4WLY9_9BACL|nr:oligosaccharide flippase family protein [Brevibacillus ruminantium]USG67133.1 oligosaccharide flippase family protein [Brevibacillus ruminantium]